MRGNARGHGVRGSNGWLQVYSVYFVYILILGLSASLATAETPSRLSRPELPLATARATYGYDLIAYIRLNSVQGPLEDTDPSIPKYNRREHFGGWRIHRPREKCSRTREVVLFRQADPNVPVRTNENCRVTSGLWLDPYSGKFISNPLEIHIDHVVPLRHAYYAGAYAWRPALRCHYSNYIYNSYHLVAVSGRENMSKGDKTPEHYLPPNKHFHCEYLSGWMKIKIIWHLWSTVDEVQAIENQFAAANCPTWMRFISFEEYETQRDMASRPIPSCLRFEARLEAESSDDDDRATRSALPPASEAN